MKRVTEEEYIAIKNFLCIADTRTAARVMQRSEAVINRISGTEDFEKYKELVKSEHTAKKPRVPLADRIHNTRVEELMVAKAQGRDSAYDYINKRLQELGV